MRWDELKVERRGDQGIITPEEERSGVREHLKNRRRGGGEPFFPLFFFSFYLSL